MLLITSTRIALSLAPSSAIKAPRSSCGVCHWVEFPMNPLILRCITKCDLFGLPHPVKRLFLGQLPTRGLTIIHRALKEVLDQFGISVLLVDMLKEGRRGNCAKIVVLAGHAQDVQRLLDQRFRIQQSRGVLLSRGPAGAGGPQKCRDDCSSCAWTLGHLGCAKEQGGQQETAIVAVCGEEAILHRDGFESTNHSDPRARNELLLLGLLFAVAPVNSRSARADEERTPHRPPKEKSSRGVAGRRRKAARVTANSTAKLSDGMLDGC